jgi:hypothetical protein
MLHASAHRCCDDPQDACCSIRIGTVYMATEDWTGSSGDYTYDDSIAPPVDRGSIADRSVAPVMGSPAPSWRKPIHPLQLQLLLIR